LGENLAAKVRKQDPSSPEAAAILFEQRIVDVKIDLRLPVTALAQEEVDVDGTKDKFFRPSGVAGVNDRLAVDGDLHAERRLAFLVRDREGLDRDAPDVDVLAADQGLEPKRKAERPSRRLFVH